MRSDDDGPTSRDHAERFDGDLFIRLAAEGWLVMRAEQAEQVIAELESTLERIRSLLRNVELAQKLRELADTDVLSQVDSLVVESVFMGQISADRWEQALVELPKYIRAFRIAGNL